jgi:hypothetical protein
MQALKFLMSDISLHKNISKCYQLRAGSCYNRSGGEKKKANACGDIKQLCIKLEPVILFQGVNQLNTEL